MTRFEASLFRAIGNFSHQIHHLIAHDGALTCTGVEVQGTAIGTEDVLVTFIQIGEDPVDVGTLMQHVLIDLVKDLVSIVLGNDQIDGLGNDFVGKFFPQIRSQDVTGSSVLQCSHLDSFHFLGQLDSNNHLRIPRSIVDPNGGAGSRVVTTQCPFSARFIVMYNNSVGSSTFAFFLEELKIGHRLFPKGPQISISFHIHELGTILRCERQIPFSDLD